MEETEEDGSSGRSRGKKRELTGAEQHICVPCTREGLFPEEQLPSPVGKGTVPTRRVF